MDIYNQPARAKFNRLAKRPLAKVVVILYIELQLCSLKRDYEYL